MSLLYMARRDLSGVRGEVLVEADEKATTLYADIGECSSCSRARGSAHSQADPELLATTRRNLPVTIQRRFDVYPDVSQGH